MQKLGLSFWDSFESWVCGRVKAGKTWWFMMFFGSMTWSQVATPRNAINPWRMRSQTASGWPELGHRSTPIPCDWRRNQMEGLKAWSYWLKNVYASYMVRLNMYTYKCIPFQIADDYSIYCKTSCILMYSMCTQWSQSFHMFGPFVPHSSVRWESASTCKYLIMKALGNSWPVMWCVWCNFKEVASSVTKFLPSLWTLDHSNFHYTRIWDAQRQDSNAAELCDDLLRLMEESQADWTMLWRQLAVVAQVGLKPKIRNTCVLFNKCPEGMGWLDGKRPPAATFEVLFLWLVELRMKMTMPCLCCW